MNFDPGLIEWSAEDSGVDNIIRMVGEYPGGLRCFTYHYPNPDATLLEHCRDRIVVDIHNKWRALPVSQRVYPEEASDPEYDRYDQEE